MPLCYLNATIYMINVNVIFNRKHRRELEVSVYNAGRRRYLALGIRLPEGAKYSNGVVNACLDAAEINNAIAAAVRSLRRQDEEGVELCDLTLRQRRSEVDVAGWIEAYIYNKYTKESSRKLYMYALKELRSGGFVYREDFISARARKFVAALQSRPRSEVYNYQMCNIAHILVRAAVRAGVLSKDCFEGVQIKAAHAREIEYLTEDEVHQVEAVRLREGSRHAKARDMFLFACYTGLAYIDIIRCSVKDVRTIADSRCISGRRQKTGQPYLIKLSDKAYTILCRYGAMNLLNCSSADAVLTRRKDETSPSVAELAGVTKRMTMHVGRHTFATIALSRGVPIEVVSKMLAHASVKTTEIYAKVIPQRVMDAYDLIDRALNQNNKNAKR